MKTLDQIPSLFPVERKVAEYIRDNYACCRPGEIAKALGVTHQSVSYQLRNLERKRMITWHDGEPVLTRAAFRALHEV